MSKLFQSLTILNFVGLVVIVFILAKSREPSQSVIPTPVTNSSSAPTLTPLSTSPTTNQGHEGHNHPVKSPSGTTITPSSAGNPTPVTVDSQPGEIKGEPGKLQTVDVLTGDPIDQNLYGDYGGIRVYFCHTGSKSRFETNVEENLQKVQEKGIVLASASRK